MDCHGAQAEAEGRPGGSEDLIKQLEVPKLCDANCISLAVTSSSNKFVCLQKEVKQKRLTSGLDNESIALLEPLWRRTSKH